MDHVCLLQDPCILSCHGAWVLSWCMGVLCVQRVLSQIDTLASKGHFSSSVGTYDSTFLFLSFMVRRSSKYLQTSRSTWK